MESVFSKILRKEVPCQFIHEDDLCVVFHDKNPQAEIHFLVIPRKPLAKLTLAEQEDSDLLDHIILVGKTVAKRLNMAEGFRVVINDGKVIGEERPHHFHLHFLGERQM